MNVGFLLNTLSMVFGVGALLAPQLVHFMEMRTGDGTGVFHVAFALAAAVACVTLLMPKGAVPPSAKEAEAADQGQGRPGGEVAAAPGLEPIIWDESEDGIIEEPPLLTDQLGGQKQKRGGAWRIPFQAALLCLIFSNVSIELGFGNW